MAERKFKLPGVQELNKDQDKVLRLPKDGQFLVVGAPGTGKSVVALLRVLKYKEDRDYIFLVYNRVLESLTRQLAKGDLNSSTWKSWYYKIVFNVIKTTVPEVGGYTPDHRAIINQLKTMEINQNPVHLIIDEGQDMPIGFYESLQYMGFENFFVVADQNQQLTDEHSSRKDLTTILVLDTDDVIELKENFRNSYGIARLAGYFYTDPSSPQPKLPPTTRKSINSPILYEYTNFDKLISFILKKSDRDPRWLIGIITPNNEIKNKYFNALKNKDIKLDNPKPVISSYSSKDKAVNIDFSKGGIVVLNLQSVKGLEFDIVFVADIDEFYIYNNDLDSVKKKFYVMVSRAIKQIVLLKKAGRKCPVEQILPEDDKILKRLKEKND